MPSYAARLLQCAAAAALPALVLATATSNAQHYGWTRDADPRITWGACDAQFVSVAGIPIDCGNLSVPLDYSDNTSSATLNLDLLRFPATKEPVKGSILLNFGGPGIPGRGDMASTGALLQLISGGHFNLIGFDPRGTGNTLTFSCFQNDTARTTATLQFPLVFGNSSDVADSNLWATGQIWATFCQTQAADIGGLIGTSFLSRDLISIVDALKLDGEDGMLRYWGFSYGTALGTTVAAMFPERIDRIIIDGVLNPYQWWHSFDEDMVTDTDKVWQGFFDGCLANSTACALAQRYPNATAAELEDRVYAFIDEIKYNPAPLILPAQLGGGAYIVDYSFVKGIILSALYGPSSWPGLARDLDSMMQGNFSALIDSIAGYLTVSEETSVDALLGIKCGDKSVRTTNRADVADTIELFASRSRIIGDYVPWTIANCAQWKLDAKERYTGDFNVTTKNPMLIVSNTYDPLTPIVSGRNASAAFAGSVLLEHHGYGHSSLAQPSLCTSFAIRRYLENGTLPKPGTICETDVPLFSDKSWADLVPFLKSNCTTSKAKRELYAAGASRMYNRSQRLL